MTMLWNVIIPDMHEGADTTWIDDFVTSDHHQFRKVIAPERTKNDWHQRRGRATPLATWRNYWRHSALAFKGDRGGSGTLTVFPQLAMTAAIQRDLYRRRGPLVAWCFNVGVFPTGLKRTLARTAMRRIDRIVVHSRGEVDLVRQMLDTEDRVVQFVHLQRAPIPVLATEDHTNPFMVAMGSANRDYATLLDAARRTRLPLTVVAAPRAVAGHDAPPNVTLRSNLTPQQCWRLAQEARISIVPIDDVGAASGQVTVLEAMRMGRPLVATRSIGTVDYVEDGKNGLLVEPRDPAALAAAMERLWHDASKRASLAAAASAYATETLSDEAAARSLVRILDEAVEARG